MNNKMTIYKIFRGVLGPIYKLWYNPTIIGKENIPKDGSFLIVGNHVHIMDQCNIIVSTKRNIHYMAKKEYFDPQYKEGKFPWFFKSAGCIPVDRSKKDEEATQHDLDVLNNKHALGLFPEGTRNALKEERIKELYHYKEDKMTYEDFKKSMKKNKTSLTNYLEELYNKKIITEEEFQDNLLNPKQYIELLVKDHRLTTEEYLDNYLLPLKFGAVSMSLKTDSYIVPYAITGDYKFRSKNLTVRIGQPFKATSDLKESNDKLKKEILSLVKENLENTGK